MWARFGRTYILKWLDMSLEYSWRIHAFLGFFFMVTALVHGVLAIKALGMEYVMDYAMAPEPLDEVVEDNGVTILIDAKAVLFLLGSEVDFEVTPLHEKFVFNNPNQTDACGCGESVTIVPVAAD